MILTPDTQIHHLAQAQSFAVGAEAKLLTPPYGHHPARAEALGLHPDCRDARLTGASSISSKGSNDSAQTARGARSVRVDRFNPDATAVSVNFS